MKVKVYREVGPVLKLGQLNSVIQDHGYLKPALPTSNGYYLFSETETGAKPIVLLGAFDDLMEFLSSSKTLGIENRIEEIPHIYMGSVLYVPGERFTGLFPIHDFIYQLVKQTADLGAAIVPEITPDSSLKWVRELASSIKDLGTWIIERMKNTKGKEKEFKKLSDMIHQPIYMKFHYLEEKGMEKIGQDKVLFKDLCEKLQRNWKEIQEANKK